MIPRTAHFIWLGPPLPDHLAELVKGFDRLHPRWTIRWWREDEIDRIDLANRDIYDAAPDIVPADSVYQFRSDIARYEILHRYGGLYVDLDFRWQKPIDPVLRGHNFVAVWEQQFKWVANGLIASRAGHPALQDAIDDIPRRVKKRNPVWRANRITGPHMWTPICVSRGVHIAHQKYFCPAPWKRPEWADQRDYPDAIAVHLWNHQREIRGLKIKESGGRD